MEVERRAWGLDEWCARYDISRGTAYNLVKEGRLSLTKIGSRTVVTVKEDEKFARSLEASSSEAFRRSQEKRRNAKVKTDAVKQAALLEARAHTRRTK